MPSIIAISPTTCHRAVEIAEAIWGRVERGGQIRRSSPYCHRTQAKPHSPSIPQNWSFGKHGFFIKTVLLTDNT